MIATEPLLLLAALAMATMPLAAAEEYTFTTLLGPRQIRGASDGAGNVARFNRLRGVAVDRAGNLYVADTGNHAIRKVTPDGVVTTLAGYASTADERGSLAGGYADAAGAAARFNSPHRA